MTEQKGGKKSPYGKQEGGFQYRSEQHQGEPSLDSWLHMRDTLISARDKRKMKRVTILIANGQREILPIDEAIIIYERLIRNAGAGHLIDAPKKQD